MSYSVKKNAMIGLLAIVADDVANRSRQRTHVQLLNDLGEFLDPQARDLGESLAQGYDQGIQGPLILVEADHPAYLDLVGATKASAKKRHEGLRAKMRRAWSSVKLSASGTFKPDSKSVALVETLKKAPINNASAVSAIDKLKAPKAKDQLYVTVSGARRIMVLSGLANSIRVARGDSIITKVPAEVRQYADASALLKDIIRLNEVDQVGRKPTSMKEKVVAAIAAFALGFGRSDLGGPEGLFPGLKPGKIQQVWEHLVALAYSGYVNSKFAQALKEFFVNPAKEVMSQSMVTLVRSTYRRQCEHRDGNADNKASFLGKGRIADPVLVRDHIEANPKGPIKTMIEFYRTMISGKAEVKARTQGMKRKEIGEAAARVPKGALRDALIAIRDGEKESLTKAVNKLTGLVKPVYLRDSNWECSGDALSQGTFDLLQRNGMKANAAGKSGRNKKASTKKKAAKKKAKKKKKKTRKRRTG